MILNEILKTGDFVVIEKRCVEKAADNGGYIIR